MNDKESKKEIKVNFNVDPAKTPVLYVDGYLIGSNDNAITFNFAQATLNPGQQQIVTRVALSRNQAKEFLKILGDHIDRFEI